MKNADLENLPVLDTRQLKPSQLQALSELFYGLAQTEFERLPGMAQCQGCCANRIPGRCSCLVCSGNSRSKA